MSLENFEPESKLGKEMKQRLSIKSDPKSIEQIISQAEKPHIDSAVQIRQMPASHRPAAIKQSANNAPPKYVRDPATREKFRGLHDFMIQKGLFFTDAYDIKFDCVKTYSLNKNGSEKAILANEKYCSNILFSELVSIGFNLRGSKHNNTLLAQGAPGLGKTVLGEYWGQIINQESPDTIADSTIQCNPQQTAETMIAHYVLEKLMAGQKEISKSGFVVNKTKIIDEIQRLPPEMFAVILQAIDSGKTKYGDETIKLSEGAIYATMNAPDAGSGGIIPAGLDRFQVSVYFNDVNANFLPALIAQGIKSNQPFAIPKELYVDTNTILTAREDIRKLSFEKNAIRKLVFYISEISGCSEASDDLERKTKSNTQNRHPSDGLCVSCHFSKKMCSYFDNSPSMRALEATLSFAAGMAWFRGKDRVDEEDVVAVLPYTLGHRLNKTQAAIDKKKVWDVDTIAFIKDTYNEAIEQFVKYQNNIPEFNKMLDDLDNPQTLACGTAANPKETIARLEGYYSSVIQKMDTVSKFAYAKMLLLGISNLYKHAKPTN